MVQLYDLKEKLKKTKLYQPYCRIRKFLFKEKISEITKKEIKNMLNTDSPVILEIGCNDGKDSEEFLKEFKKIKLYCFEPDPRAINKFKNRIRDKRCKLYPFAISNKEGQIEFFLSEGKIPLKEGEDSSSIKKPRKHLKRFPWIRFDKKIFVKTISLDKWVKKNKIKKIDFIWADVQGAEKELILGGLNTLNEKTKYFYSEFYNSELYEGQIPLKKILEMLPNFKIIKIYGNNVLLKNKNIN
jgi:FkbM family methyltransferase